MIAVTGAKGMVGQHLVRLLESKNIPSKSITRIDWDLENWLGLEELDNLFDGCEAVFHVGAQLPKHRDLDNNFELKELFDANVRSCLNLADWACIRGIPLVFISSSTVYENPHSSRIVESAPKVVNGFGGFYGYTKKLAEDVFFHYASQGLKLIVLRPTSIYGHGLPADKLVMSILSKAQNDQTITVNQADSKVNLIHAFDVAKGAMDAYENQAWGVYNLAGQLYSIKEIAETAAWVAGKGRLKILEDEYTPYIRFDLSDELAKREFGYKSSVDLKKGLELMLNGQLII